MIYIYIYIYDSSRSTPACAAEVHTQRCAMRTGISMTQMIMTMYDNALSDDM